MEAMASLSLALSAAWASGLNIYLAVLMLGLLSAIDVIDLPNSLQVLSDPLVLVVAGIVYFIEFFADKIPGVDSLWDAFHTFIRVPAGALLAAGAVSDMAEPVQVAAVMLGGGLVALGTHATKAGGRAAINTSPEPVSNWIVSLVEDVLVVVGIVLALTKPVLFLGLFVLFCLLALWLLPRVWRGLKAIFRRLTGRTRPDGMTFRKRIGSGFDLSGPDDFNT